VLFLKWRKSTWSYNNGNCVEVRLAMRTVDMRDSKHRSGATLRFSRDSWREFLDGVRLDEFDRP
jgi:Domain of unknown function (DUF397)